MDHFLECDGVNKSGAYRVLSDRYRHAAHGSGLSDYLINNVNKIMCCIMKSPKRYPLASRGVYKKQRSVGWKHFVRGRVVYQWDDVLRVSTQNLSPVADRKML